VSGHTRWLTVNCMIMVMALLLSMSSPRKQDGMLLQLNMVVRVISPQFSVYA